jgi:hypothetical protein
MFISIYKVCEFLHIQKLKLDYSDFLFLQKLLKMIIFLFRKLKKQLFLSFSALQQLNIVNNIIHIIYNIILSKYSMEFKMRFNHVT